MNPILHALFARPFGSEFMRQRGSVHTEWCDRDNLVFDAKGNMVIGADGLPKLDGVPQEFD